MWRNLMRFRSIRFLLFCTWSTGALANPNNPSGRWVADANDWAPAWPSAPPAIEPRPIVYQANTVEGPKYTIELQSKQNGLAFYVEQSTRSQNTGRVMIGADGQPMIENPGDPNVLLCNAPCTTQMPAGEYRFGVSNGKGDVVMGTGKITIDGPSKLDANYVSYRSTRAAGVALLVGGNLLVLTATMAGIFQKSFTTQTNAQEKSGAYIALGGLSIMAIITGLGIYLVSHDDVVTIKQTNNLALSVLVPVRFYRSDAMLQNEGAFWGGGLQGAF